MVALRCPVDLLMVEWRRDGRSVARGAKKFGKLVFVHPF